MQVVGGGGRGGGGGGGGRGGGRGRGRKGEEREDRKERPSLPEAEVLASLGRSVLLREVLKLSSLISVTELARSLKLDNRKHNLH